MWGPSGDLGPPRLTAANWVWCLSILMLITPLAEVTPQQTQSLHRAANRPLHQDSSLRLSTHTVSPCMTHHRIFEHFCNVWLGMNEETGPILYHACTHDTWKYRYNNTQSTLLLIEGSTCWTFLLLAVVNAWQMQSQRAYWSLHCCPPSALCLIRTCLQEIWIAHLHLKSFESGGSRAQRQGWYFLLSTATACCESKSTRCLQGLASYEIMRQAVNNAHQLRHVSVQQCHLADAV